MKPNILGVIGPGFLNQVPTLGFIVRLGEGVVIAYSRKGSWVVTI